MNRSTRHAAAAQLAIKTADAYSVERYTSWTACAEYLLKAGFSLLEAEAVLRSKHMRWAADSSRDPRYGRATSADLERYLELHNARRTPGSFVSRTGKVAPGSPAVRELIDQTF